MFLSRDVFFNNGVTWATFAYILQDGSGSRFYVPQNKKVVAEMCLLSFIIIILQIVNLEQT